MNGFTDTDLINKVLQLNPADKHSVIREIKNVYQTPLLAAMIRQVRKLKRREWLLDTLNSVAKFDKEYLESPKIISAPSFDVFVRDYYAKNKPVVLSGGMDKWPALKNGPLTT